MKKWKIEIYERGQSTEISATTISHVAFTKEQMVTLLQRLASRNLPVHEVIDASRVSGSVGYSSSLEVTEKLNGNFLSAGNDPKYIARLVD